MADIKIKRIYRPWSPDDGYRILIDRLWPRGVKKADAHLDIWMKDIAPSVALRQAFHHGSETWPSFSAKYIIELKKNTAAVNDICRIIREQQHLTLLYAAKDEQHNHALVLLHFLQDLLDKK